MKTLLISLLFCVSVITQAQMVKIGEYRYAPTRPEVILLNKIDSLYQRVYELGNRIDTLLYFPGDSIVNYADFWENLDSFIVYHPPKALPSQIPVTLQNLFDYEQECYNDSIPEDWEWVELASISDNGGITFYKVKKTHYKHIEPTFEGFIAYLRKWYKNYMK